MGPDPDPDPDPDPAGLIKSVPWRSVARVILHPFRFAFSIPATGASCGSPATAVTVQPLGKQEKHNQNTRNAILYKS